jgi:hypothetical protein
MRAAFYRDNQEKKTHGRRWRRRGSLFFNLEFGRYFQLFNCLGRIH